MYGAKGNRKEMHYTFNESHYHHLHRNFFNTIQDSKAKYYILDQENQYEDDESFETIHDNTILQTQHKYVHETEHVHENGQVCLKKNITETCPSRNIFSEQFQVEQTVIPNIKPVEYQDDDNKKEGKIPPEPDRMDWNNYHRLQVIHDFMDELEFDFPSICTVEIIGKSLEMRDLKVLKISNSDATNASVWIDAGIHAREWIGPAVATYLADHITRNFDTLPRSISNKDWYFLPVMNPDGYEHSHTKARMWRKNRAWFKGQCVGVDLNRNFSHGWGGKGSSDAPINAFYRGPEPFSEPESTAVKDVLSNAGISFKVYITLHSYGQIIIFPYAYRDQLCPDYIRLLEGATVMSKAIYNTNGNIYKVGISKDVMYVASGTSNDWSYGVAGIPYCYLIELRSKKHKFRLPNEEIQETAIEILNCVKDLMEFVDNYPLKKTEVEATEAQDISKEK